MRLVIFKPQIARIGIHIREIFRAKEKAAYNKYCFFIPHFFNNKNIDIAIYSEPNSFYEKCKLILWMIINKIKFWNIPIITKQHDLHPNTDILLIFPFLTCSNFYKKVPNNTAIFNTFHGLKFFHFTHYFIHTSVAGENLKNTNNYVVIGEGNLLKNSFFIKYFPYVKDFFLLPFALRKRYTSFQLFNNRKNKCIAFGTVHPIPNNEYTDFRIFFQINCFHRMRQTILENKDKINDYIDSFIFNYYENSSEMQKGWAKYFSFFQTKRKKFFSFDIVEKYNEYKMFISPEEESGAPSINFIEGMACGCAYLGRKDFYDDFGLIDGIHYIAYDGTLPDLLQKIHFYQNNQKQLSQIASQGYEFVHNNFTAEKISSFLYKNINKYHHQLIKKDLL